MTITTNFIGLKFGRLLVVDKAGVDHRQQTLYKCVCDCGTEKIVRSYSLKSNNTKSCGCWRVDMPKNGFVTKHGLARKPTHRSWEAMKDRCLNPQSTSYKYYGAMGVTFCKEWESFDAFLNDMGVRPEGTTLDRIDPHGNYEPSNCRWANSATQASNKRIHHKEQVCL